MLFYQQRGYVQFELIMPGFVVFFLKKVIESDHFKNGLCKARLTNKICMHPKSKPQVYKSHLYNKNLVSC